MVEREGSGGSGINPSLQTQLPSLPIVKPNILGHISKRLKLETHDPFLGEKLTSQIHCFPLKVAFSGQLGAEYDGIPDDFDSIDRCKQDSMLLRHIAKEGGKSKLRSHE